MTRPYRVQETVTQDRPPVYEIIDGEAYSVFITQDKKEAEKRSRFLNSLPYDDGD